MQWLDHLIKSPKSLLGIDAIGALLSGVSLAFIATLDNHLFGLASSDYKSLSAFAFGLTTLSTIGFLSFPNRASFFLRMAISLNGAYLLYTGSVLVGQRHALTVLDLVYFLFECAIIVVLIWTEIKAFQQLSEDR